MQNFRDSCKFVLKTPNFVLKPPFESNFVLKTLTLVTICIKHTFFAPRMLASLASLLQKCELDANLYQAQLEISLFLDKLHQGCHALAR